MAKYAFLALYGNFLKKLMEYLKTPFFSLSLLCHRKLVVFIKFSPKTGLLILVTLFIVVHSPSRSIIIAQNSISKYCGPKYIQFIAANVQIWDMNDHVVLLSASKPNIGVFRAIGSVKSFTSLPSLK